MGSPRARGEDGCAVSAAESFDVPAGELVSRRRIKARTTSMRRLSKRELLRGTIETLFYVSERPRTRGECPVERPCPFVSCAYHLALDVDDRTGSVKLNHPSDDDDELSDLREIPETCALDAADRGGMTLEEVGEIMNLVREAVAKIEGHVLAKLSQDGTAQRLFAESPQ